MKKIIKSVSRPILEFNQNRYIYRLRKRNLNKNPTIVTNNCIGGIIYHNLGLQFQSPTINLFIPTEDYVEFVKHFKYYSTCDMEEVKLPNIDYPVGKLVSNDNNYKPILIHFQHDKSFLTAKAKWKERYERVNWNNIFYILEFYHSKYDKTLVKEFDNLQLENKIILSHKKFGDLKNQFVLSCYKNDKPVAKVLQYKGISGKRYLDEFDYVKFLNPVK